MKKLSDLYPAGTPMREVHPEFRGMPWREWQWQKLTELANALPKVKSEDAPLSKQAVWTPRDDYGMKGL